ncbi:MAG: acyl-CoA dehydrogenase family protein [Gemmataceae bacterium]
MPATRVAPKSMDDPGDAIAHLQAAHAKDGTVFVLQDELNPLIHKDGGGACATAAAVDALQAVRVMSGRKPLPNPHKAALAAFADHPELLAGRVPNAKLVAVLDSFRRPPHDLAVATTVVSAPNSGYREHTRTWDESAGPDLGANPRQLKLLSYTVTDSGEVIGRHFVLLKRFADRRVTVLDPSGPQKDRVYEVEYKRGEKGDKARVLLQNPPEHPRRPGLVYELNTVFTVTLSDGPAATPGQGRPLSVDEMNLRIDETAKELSGTKGYLDPRVWRKRTAAFGLPGLDLPVELGGSGWPAAKVVEVFRHAGRHNLNFRDVVGGAHVRPLLKSNTPAVRDIVKQVARGDGYIAIAITEPEAGTDIPAIRSTARKADGGFLLTGTKRYNARLDQASHVVIFTQGTTGVSGKLSAFVVPIDAPGLKVESFPAHGLTGNSYGGLEFKDLFVPAGQLLGEDGEGLKIFFEHFLYWRLMQSAAAIGTGENALEQMKDRIKARQAFGGPIGRFTHLQQPIGQHTTELRMAHALAREIAERIDRGDYDKETRALICGLKAEGVEIAIKAVDAATRAFGGEGYSTRVDLGDRLRDLNGLRIADGTTDVMRMEVVRQTFGEEFWEMAVDGRKQPNK